MLSSFGQSLGRSDFLASLARLPRQLVGASPFQGTLKPARIPILFGGGRPTLPFPHPWNFQHPLLILESYFWRADQDEGPSRHTRYLDVPGFAPVLVTRSPSLIRAVLTATGDAAGQFDRDTLPSTGIARATGPDTLLFANGPLWRRQRKLAAAPFGKTSLFNLETFQGFESTFRATVSTRLAALVAHLEQTGKQELQLAVEPEIKALMLELLANSFFGAELTAAEIRSKYVPALDRVISHIVQDTVTNRLGIPRWVLARFSRRQALVEQDFQVFEQLTDAVLKGRSDQRGLWLHFQSAAPDDALRSNLKVFLAGALEATTSYACWAIAHLSRETAAQQQVWEEVREISEFTPAAFGQAKFLQDVLEETLRFTPSLYFLPRRASAETRIETADGHTLTLPRGTHLLLDVWHANRHEDHWGIAASGYPAGVFAPARWQHPALLSRGSKEVLHFGFGHGARVCPGKHLGQMEVALVVGAFVKLFEFRAVQDTVSATAGVSTKPADGTEVILKRR